MNDVQFRANTKSKLYVVRTYIPLSAVYFVSRGAVKAQKND